VCSGGTWASSSLRRRFSVCETLGVIIRPATPADAVAIASLLNAFLPTSTSARQTSFRPPVDIADQQTLVMCDQLATVDLSRLTEPISFLTIEEMERVDEALAVVLDL